MSAKSHPASMRFIPDLIAEGTSINNNAVSPSDVSVRQPSRYILFPFQVAVWILTHELLSF